MYLYCFGSSSVAGIFYYQCGTAVNDAIKLILPVAPAKKPPVCTNYPVALHSKFALVDSGLAWTNIPI